MKSSNYSEKLYGNPTDEKYTSGYGVLPIIRYIPGGKTVWCPFDTKHSELMQKPKDADFHVVHSRIYNGQNFFSYELSQWGILVSNPPFNRKVEIFGYCLKLEKPFVLLMPNYQPNNVTPCRFFQDTDLELFMFNERTRSGKGENVSSNSSYFCYKIFPKQIILEQVDVTDKPPNCMQDNIPDKVNINPRGNKAITNFQLQPCISVKKNLFGIMLLSGISILPKANVQTTYEEMGRLTVNEQIATAITTSEPIRFVDISADKVAGDQPIDNIIRLKPKENRHEDSEMPVTITIVAERYRIQYTLIYTTRMKEAVTDKRVLLQERNAYNNPVISVPIADMTHHAWHIWNSPVKTCNVATRAHRMAMRLSNIHLVGDYFFIDLSIGNKTSIRFDIGEIRMKLADKKLVKATSTQTIELASALILESGKMPRHGYQNAIVVKKMTFPNDRLLTIEMMEKQISGRSISLDVDYEDIPAADSFRADSLEKR